VTREVEEFSVALAARSRDEPVTWPIRSALTVRREPHRDGMVGMVAEGDAEFDLATAQGGARLAPAVWDLTVQGRWGGLSRRTAPRSKGSSAVLTGAGAAIAYTSKKGNLAVDTVQRLRSLLVEGRLPFWKDLGPAGEPFSIPLRGTLVAAPTSLHLKLLARASDGTSFGFPATVRGEADGARLESRVVLGAGTYSLRALADGQTHSVALPRRLVARRDGEVVLRPDSKALRGLPSQWQDRIRSWSPRS
jgi:hypothetical protein